MRSTGQSAVVNLSAPRSGPDLIARIGIRPIIFSVNCFISTILAMFIISTILAMFIAFSLDLKSPGWAMTTVYLTSQPLSGVLRAKAVYRVIGTFIGGAAMVAIVTHPSLRRSRSFFGSRSVSSFRCSTAHRDPTCSCCPAIPPL
jgi:hypothetical protein